MSAGPKSYGKLIDDFKGGRRVELGARVGKVHHEFAASEREAHELVDVARQLHAMVAHQILDPFRQRAAVEDLIELGARFLLLVLADEQA